MKIVKYLYKPMKYLMLLIMFAALIYYRSVIFHSNVNQYIDGAVSYVETKLDVNIPYYFSEIGDDENQLAILPTEKSVKIVVDEERVEMERAEVVDEPEGNEVVVDESSKLDAVDAAVQKDEKSDLIENLSATVNMIQQKVDMLFEMSNETSDARKKDEGKVKEVVVEVDEVKPVIAKLKSSDALKSEPSISTDKQASDSSRILFIARQSFWNGDSELSEKFYLDLAQHEDTDPDVYGELGNVYYAQGKWKQAGEAYYEAAVRLLALKKNDQINYLLRVIQGLDKKSADKLRQKMSG